MACSKQMSALPNNETKPTLKSVVILCRCGEMATQVSDQRFRCGCGHEFLVIVIRAMVPK